MYLNKLCGHCILIIACVGKLGQEIAAEITFLSRHSEKC